jgi:hypothetical protein
LNASVLHWSSGVFCPHRLRRARARQIWRSSFEATSGKAEMGDLSCERLGRGEVLLEDATPSGFKDTPRGVSVRTVFMWGRHPTWTSGEAEKGG